MVGCFGSTWPNMVMECGKKLEEEKDGAPLWHESSRKSSDMQYFVARRLLGVVTFSFLLERMMKDFSDEEVVVKYIF